MTLDENLQLLEDWIRRLKIEYDIFFSGAVRKPPYDLRNRVDALLKRLLEEKKMMIMQRYRYNSLVARYSSYRDLWRRLTQEKELGISPESMAQATRARSAPALTLASKNSGSPFDAAAPRLEQPGDLEKATAPADPSVKIRISDPSQDITKVHELYNLLVAAQTHIGEKKILPFNNFCSLVRSQTEKLKKTTQCRYVTFNISIEDGKVKFTAKADPT